MLTLNWSPSSTGYPSNLWAVSCLLYSCKLGANGSFTNFLCGWWKCYPCTCKLRLNKKVLDSPSSLPHVSSEMSPQIGAPSTSPYQKVVDGWYCITSHWRQPNCFYWAMSWYFASVTQHHPTYANNHCSLETHRMGKPWEFSYEVPAFKA